MNELQRLVDVWRVASADFVALASELPDAEWSRPTDLEGWDVHDIVAHIAALEAEVAGDEPLRATIDKDAAHIKNNRGIYTERGVVARRDATPAQLVAEISDAVSRHSAQLDTEPLDDPTARPPITPGGIDWDWATMMRNRSVDLWVHEQDIRRAVGRPGGLDNVGARHTQGVFGLALPYIVAKLAAAPAGSSVVADITGPVVETYSVVVGDDGRGRPTSPDGAPTTLLRMDTEAFTTVAAGRRTPEQVQVEIVGDRDLARRVLASMVLTW